MSLILFGFHVSRMWGLSCTETLWDHGGSGEVANQISKLAASGTDNRKERKL